MGWVRGGGNVGGLPGMHASQTCEYITLAYLVHILETAFFPLENYRPLVQNQYSRDKECIGVGLENRVSCHALCSSRVQQ